MTQKKFIVLSVSTLLVLLTLTIGVTALVLNIQNLRSSFAEYITQQTKRNVTIGGDIEIDIRFSESASWLLTLKLEDVKIYNRPNFSAEPMLHVPWAELEFGLLSIATGRFNMHSLLIERPRFDLVRLTDGRSNWQDIGILAAVPAKQVNVYAGVVHWLDRRTQQVVKLSDLSWRGRTSETDPTISWQTSFQLLSEVLRSPLAVRLSANSQFKTGQSRGVVLNEIVGGVTGPGLVLSMKLTEVSTNLDSGRIHAAQTAVTVSVDGTEVALKLNDLNIDTSTGQIGVALLDADCFIGQFTPTIAADAIAIDLPSKRMVVPRVVGSWLGTELLGNLSVTWVEGEPEILADFDIPSANVEAILHKAGIKSMGFMSTKPHPVSLNGKLHLHQNQLALGDLTVKSDDTVITGWVRHRRKDSVAWTFALESDDFFLVDQTENGSRFLTTAGVLAGLLADRLSDLPSDVTAAGSIVVERLLFDRMLAENVTAKIRSKDKLMSVALLSGELYDGTGKVILWLDRRAEEPRLLVRQALSDINVGNFLRDLDGITGIEASGDLEFVLVLQGQTSAELLNNTRGIATVGLRDGELSVELLNRIVGDFDAELVRSMSTYLPGLEVERVSTTIRIDRGIVQNQDFRVVGRGFWVEGKGLASLSAGALDYKVLLVLENDLSSDLRGIPVIPFQITGSLDDPKIAIDVQELVRYKVEQQLTGVLPEPSNVMPDQAAAVLIRQLDQQIKNIQQSLDSE